MNDIDVDFSNNNLDSARAYKLLLNLKKAP